MKLYRFFAENSHDAMQRVTTVLGAGAAIYVTRRVEKGVEVLAAAEEGRALGLHYDVVSEVNVVDADDAISLDKLNLRLQLFNENLNQMMASLMKINPKLQPKLQVTLRPKKQVKLRQWPRMLRMRTLLATLFGKKVNNNSRIPVL